MRCTISVIAANDQNEQRVSASHLARDGQEPSACQPPELDPDRSIQLLCLRFRALVFLNSCSMRSAKNIFNRD